MKNLLFILLAVVLFTSCSKNYEVYYNAVIHTVDDEAPIASAMVVLDGKIVYVGNDEVALKYGKGNDMQGKTIVPGFIDSHTHPTFGMLSPEDLLHLDYKITIADIQKKLREFLVQKPNAKYIRAQGYSLGEIERLPTKEDLDAVSTTIPIIIHDESFHSHCANSYAFDAAGITDETPDPQPGAHYFEKDKSGKKTGYYYENIILIRMLKANNFATPEVVEKSLNMILPALSSYGYTGIFEAAGGSLHAGVVFIEVIDKMYRENRLPFYYSNCLIADPDDEPKIVVEKLAELDKKYTHYPNVIVKTVKLIADGTTDIKLAGMTQNYVGTKSCGMSFFTEDQMYNFGKEAASKNYDIHIHTIGDSTMANALRSYARLQKDGIGKNMLKTVVHSQVWNTETARLFCDLSVPFNVFNSTTPIWAFSSETQRKILGDERYQTSYRVGSLLRNGGANVSFSMDWPATPIEYCQALRQIYYATRPVGLTVPGGESEGVSVAEALKCQTLIGAKNLGIGDITGSLKVGKYADFVVLDKDIMTIAPSDLMNTKVLNTYFQGKNVFTLK